MDGDEVAIGRPGSDLWEDSVVDLGAAVRPEDRGATSAEVEVLAAADPAIRGKCE